MSQEIKPLTDAEIQEIRDKRWSGTTRLYLSYAQIDRLLATLDAEREAREKAERLLESRDRQLRINHEVIEEISERLQDAFVALTALDAAKGGQAPDFNGQGIA